MKKIVKLSLAVAMMSGIGAANAQAADGMNILSDIKVKGQIRPRYESADDGSTNKGQSFTAKTKLTVTGGLFEVEGLTSSIGMISVNNFGWTDYNAGAGGHGDATGNGTYGKIVDPQDAMISEATIDYKTGNIAAHFGRSNINLDNQRFIGTVGWRQLERSYDTAYVGYSDKKLNVLGAYVYGFAGVKNVVTTRSASVLLNASYKVMPELKVTGYAYMLSSKHDTYGIAATGKIDAGAKITYRAEYAIQSDATFKTNSYDATKKADASYMNLDVGANISGILAGFNYEAQSGTDGTGTATAFTTPLGTNHKFNGWADQFLSTPSVGLNDLNVRVGYKAKGLGKLMAVYHIFTSAVDAAKASDGTATTDLGSEIDVVYANAIPGTKGLKGLVKYASFTAGDSTVKTNDVTKIWAGVDYKF